MAQGDAQQGKWRGNWRMEWVASTLHTTSEHGVSSITTADAHTSAASNRLNWRPAADLNWLVRFAERQNLVSARVPSHFKRSLQRTYGSKYRGFPFQIRVSAKFHFLLKNPYLLWGQRNGYRWVFPWGETTEAWCWTLNQSSVEVKERVELYLDSDTSSHGRNRDKHI